MEIRDGGMEERDKYSSPGEATRSRHAIPTVLALCACSTEVLLEYVERANAAADRAKRRLSNEGLVWKTAEDRLRSLRLGDWQRLLWCICELRSWEHLFVILGQATSSRRAEEGAPLPFEYQRKMLPRPQAHKYHHRRRCPVSSPKLRKRSSAVSTSSPR